MISRTVIPAICGVLLSLSVYPQTIVPGGNVSGTWTAVGSPYLIDGEITVASADTLRVEPGVEVVFRGHYKMIVNGWLYADGTETDSILFTAADPDTGWHSIRFIDAPDSSHLFYCIVQYGFAPGWATYPNSRGGGVYCLQSNPVIVHCTIKQCWTENEGSGGAIACIGSNPRIDHCAITGNTAGMYGGGIYCSDQSNPTITNCGISGNSAVMYYYQGRGGGIFCGYDSNPIIEDCEIRGNTAKMGGGIYGYISSPEISECAIIENTALENGGGIHLWVDCNATIKNCTFTENRADGDESFGGGIFCDYHTCPSIQNCIFTGNSAVNGGGITCYEQSNPLIDNCTISDNAAIDGGGLYCGDNSTPIINTCLFSGNTVTGGGGGIHCYASSPTIVNCTIYGNSSGGGGCGIGCISFSVPSIVNCIIWNNSLTQIYGYPDVTYTDVMGGWVGVGNIAEDPLFVDVTNNDFNLQWGSPCIDTGNPDPQYFDPDSTFADMGAYYYDQSLLTPQIFVDPDTIEFGEVILGESSTLPMVIYNMGDENLILYDIFTSDPSFGTDFNPVDSLIGPSDSLVVLVIFVPQDTIGYAEILSIDSNDEMVEVELLGVGIPPDAIDNNLLTSTPHNYAMQSPFPNPFNATTTFTVKLPAVSRLRITIFDLHGCEISQLVNEQHGSGLHHFAWDAANLSSGMYFYQIQTDELVRCGKVVFIK